MFKTLLQLFKSIPINCSYPNCLLQRIHNNKIPSKVLFVQLIKPVIHAIIVINNKLFTILQSLAILENQLNKQIIIAWWKIKNSNWILPNNSHILAKKILLRIPLLNANTKTIIQNKKTNDALNQVAFFMIHKTIVNIVIIISTKEFIKKLLDYNFSFVYINNGINNIPIKNSKHLISGEVWITKFQTIPGHFTFTYSIKYLITAIITNKTIDCLIFWENASNSGVKNV